MAAPPNTAERLKPPPARSPVAAGPNRDATSIATLKSYGLTITDPNPASADGKLMCVLIRQDRPGTEVANAYMSSNPTMRLIDAADVVFAAVSAYCPGPHNIVAVRVVNPTLRT
ncbi:DUF732 domain-containing protein [Mycobacterium spongiae]|uniref:DUF732 domain-containing protein n=1 Tax=Mycobacterium spongiae TaxID=886343 RepID=UPI001BA7DF7D